MNCYFTVTVSYEEEPGVPPVTARRENVVARNEGAAEDMVLSDLMAAYPKCVVVAVMSLAAKPNWLKVPDAPVKVEPIRPGDGPLNRDIEF